MTIVSKDEEQWWTARNSLGQTGSIPVPYVVKVKHFHDQIWGLINTNMLIKCVNDITLLTKDEN